MILTRRSIRIRFLLCTLLFLSVSSVAVAKEANVVTEVYESALSTFKTITSKAFGASVERDKNAVNSEQPQFTDLIEQQVLTFTKENGEVQAYQIAVARSHADMTNGLMWRKEMPKDVGMIFVFRDNVVRHFWMRNTYLSLDMLFLDSNGEILHIHEGATPLDETRISSNVPAAMTLELNAGQVKKHGYKVGGVIGGIKRLSN